MKTKLEIIEETAAYYSEDTSRRALIPGDRYICSYLTPDGKSCALGRCLIDPGQFAKNNYVAYDLFNLEDIEILKPDYRVDDAKFWTDIQNFHDDQENWNEEGLTETGEERLFTLKRKYKLCSEK